MTWVHSPNLAYFPAMAGIPLASDSQVCQPGPSATLSGTNTAKNLSKPESKTDSWMMRQFGMTSKPLTGNPGVDLWILLLRDFHVSRTQLPDSGAEKLTSAISGQTPLESLAKWDQDSSCWRTFQGWEPPKGSISELLKSHGNSVYLTKTITSRTQGPSTVVTSRLSDSHTWDELSGSFPTSVLMRNGTLYRLPPLVPRTFAGGGGVWPTPRAEKTGGYSSQGFSPTLEQAVRWPTPKASDPKVDVNDTGEYARRETTYMALPIAVKLKGTAVGGNLNPEFVEWLQGVPQGWTSLDPLPAESYQRWQQGDHWQDGEWEGVPRVAKDIADRVNRLRALGNGIVPAVVAKFLRSNQ
jgi:hypothetical protein